MRKFAPSVFENVPMVDGIYKTMFVTFPRSGHHALVRVAASYFGSRFHYCEPYKNNRCMLEKDPLTNAQKTHDFHQENNVCDNLLYVVQLRNFVHCLLSWDHMIRVDKVNVHGIWRDAHDNTRESWHASSMTRLQQYAAFVEKWVLNYIPNRIILCYEDFVREPLVSCLEVFQFITGQTEEISISRLRKSIDAIGIHESTHHATDKWHLATQPDGFQPEVAP